MVPQITAQLYSVRDLAKQDYAATIHAIAATGFGCVEPAGYPGYSASKAAHLFADLGLKAPSAHIGLPIGDKTNAIIEEALMMDHKYLITGCPPKFREHYTSLDNIKAMAELYCEAAANLSAHGIQVGYHNHDWDLVKIDGRLPHQVFLENTPDSVLYEADIFWVSRAGLDPAAFITEIGARGKVLHFKDGIVSNQATVETAEIDGGRFMVSDSIPFRVAGTGQVDLVSAAKAMAHTEYIAVELDSFDGDMMQAVKDSYTYLTANGIARGTK